MIRAALALVLAAGPAVAQTAVCGPREAVATTLARQFGEVRTGMGLAGGAAMVELSVSPVTRSWTLTVTGPDGRTCLAASGESWEPMRDPGGEPG